MEESTEKMQRKQLKTAAICSTSRVTQAETSSNCAVKDLVTSLYLKGAMRYAACLSADSFRKLFITSSFASMAIVKHLTICVWLCQCLSWG